MNSFFNLDGPFYKWGTELADVMILSLLWLVCSLPVFTVGASTTALFYVYGKKVRGEDPYVFKSFFKSFKNNFKQATVITVILGVLWMSVYLYYQILTGGNAQLWLKIMGLFYILQVIVITLYVFPILSRFEMTIKNLLITSFLFGNKHLPTTIGCAILFAGFLFVVMTPTPLLIFAFGVYALLSSYLLQRIFTKYIEDREKASQAEDEKELEELDNLEELEGLEDLKILDGIENFEEEEEEEDER